MELDAFFSFYRLLYLARMRREEDRLWWVLPKKGYLVLNPSTVSWVVIMVSVSLRRMFGGLRFR